jgi:signal transduction histidine kinase
MALIDSLVLNFFNQFTKTRSIQHSLRCVESIIIIAFFLTILESPYSDYSSKIFMLLLLCAWVALSLIFPLDRPLWQRRTYIGVEIILVTIARSGNWYPNLLIFLVIIESCFLLNRRDALITSIVGGIGWIVPLLWLTPSSDDTQQQIFNKIAASRMFSNRIIYSLWFSEVLACIVTSIFILLIGFLAVNEYKNQQQIQLLNQEVETLGTLLERTRIARNIHDTLGHTLTALGMQLEVAQQTCRSHPDQTFQRLGTARLLADECFQDIRSVVAGLRQSDFDLAQGLTGLMIHLEQTQPIVTKIQLNLPLLTLQTSYQIYCIIQEGITNIQKHANASFVSLQTQVNEDSLVIELSDDGQGFDPSQSTSGFGLQGMRERLQLIGGVLQIQTALGQGTQLRILVLCYEEN